MGRTALELYVDLYYASNEIHVFLELGMAS
jgi:hypothetical protein